MCHPSCCSAEVFAGRRTRCATTTSSCSASRALRPRRSPHLGTPLLQRYLQGTDSRGLRRWVPGDEARLRTSSSQPKVTLMMHRQTRVLPVGGHAGY